MSHTPTNIDAPWAAHLIPWVSSADAPVPAAIGEPFGLQPEPGPHPCSTNTDHTGLRGSLDQFRLPRHASSVTAA